jgi:hypothetical protein
MTRRALVPTGASATDKLSIRSLSVTKSDTLFGYERPALRRQVEMIEGLHNALVLISCILLIIDFGIVFL